VIKFRINKDEVEWLMARRCLNYVDLAKKLGVRSPQMHYIVNSGGKRYAPALAKILQCDPKDIIIVKGE
jgi:DNA-binding Xre family transcriptional regulator